MRNNTAFTLIELLVVIAIISLLVTILLPSLSAAKELARKAVCASKVRNLSIAATIYAGEHHGYLPTSDPIDRQSIVNPLRWCMNPDLLDYLGLTLSYDDAGEPIGPVSQPPALICPSHDQPELSNDGISRTFALSYVCNGAWGVGNWCSMERTQRKLSEFGATAGVQAFSDGNNTKVETVGVVLYHGCPKQNFDYRHRDYVNAAFLDGHVNSLKPDDIPFGRNMRYEPFWSEKE